MGRTTEALQAHSLQLRELTKSRLDSARSAQAANAASCLAIEFAIVGDMQAAMKNARIATTYANKCLGSIHAYATAQMAWGWVNLYGGNSDEAKRAVDRIRARDTTRLSEDYHCNLSNLEGNILIAASRWDEAQSAANDIVEISGGSSLKLQGQAVTLIAQAKLGRMLGLSASPSSKSLQELDLLFNDAINILKKSESIQSLAFGYIRRSVLHIACGKWNAASQI